MRVGTRADSLVDLRRDGAINLVGAAVTGAGALGLALVLGHLLGPAGAGAFMEGVAVFSVASVIAQVGANVGIVKFLPPIRHDRVKAAALVRFAGARVTAIACGLGAVIFFGADTLAALMAQDGNVPLLEDVLRGMAPFLPAGAMSMFLMASTQASGTMVPAAAIEKSARPLLQLLAVSSLLAVGLAPDHAALAWAAAFTPMALALGLWQYRLLGRVDASRFSTQARREFWRFSGPRGLAAGFQICLLWVDTLLLGALRSTEEAGIYSLAGRYLIVGNLVATAVIHAFGPAVSSLFANEDHAGVQTAYRTASVWLIRLVWPLYIVMAFFAASLLTTLGPGFARGATALSILAVAMLFDVAVGPVDVVLLMDGRSWLSSMNWGLALLLNVALNLVLIPAYGIAGAAISWAVAIIVRNALPVVQIWQRRGIHPFGESWRRGIVSAVVLVAIPVALVRVVAGQGIPGLVLAAGATVPYWLMLVRRGFPRS